MSKLRSLPSWFTRPAPAAMLWVAVALLVRLTYLFEAQRGSVLFWHPSLDEREMQLMAEGLLSGKGFGPEPLFKAPLYPLFLAGMMAVTGEAWPLWARLLQHLGGALLVGLVFDLSRRLAGRERGVAAGHVAAGLLALSGPLVRLEGSLLLDFQFLLLTTGTGWALVRGWPLPAKARLRWVALAGLLAALAWLTRPTVTVLLPVMALALLLRGGVRSSGRLKRGAREALVFALLPVAAVGAVYVRNQVSGHEGMGMPWQGGYNLYEANRSGSTGRYLKQTAFAASETGNPTRTLAEQGFRQAVERGEVPAPAQGRLFHAINGYWNAKALAEIRQNPSAWLGLMGRKLLYLTSDREVYNLEVYEVERRLSPVLSALPVSFGWVWPLSLLSLAVLPVLSRRRRAGVVGVWVGTALLAGAIALYFASGRLRMPLLPPLAALAGVGVAVLASELRRHPVRARRWLPAAVTLGVAGGVLSFGDWWGVRSERLDHVEYARLSRAAYAGERYPLALQYADAAEAYQPGYPTLPGLRGQALFGLGRYPEAADAFTQAVRAVPGDPVAAFNLGSVLDRQLNQPEKALAAFQEALRRDPAYHRAAWTGALAAVRLRKPELAARMLQGHLPQQVDERAPRPLLTALTVLHLTRGEAESARQVLLLAERAGGTDGVKALEAELHRAGLALPAPKLARRR